MSISERPATSTFFFQKLYSHIDKNSGGKFEDMFLIKIASKGTSLDPSTHLRLDLKKNDWVLDGVILFRITFFILPGPYGLPLQLHNKVFKFNSMKN